MLKTYTIALSSLLINSVLGHSWVECISRADGGTNIPDDVGHPEFLKNCIGFPRAFPGRVAESVIDEYTYLIIDNKPSTPACSYRDMSRISYSEKYPMAEVPAGTSLKIWYSMNGHRNEYKPDVGLYSYKISGKQFYFDNEINPDLILGTYPFATNNNCFNMKNNDNTMCWNEWTVPSNWQPGVYSIVWKWKFNSNGGHEEYNTCFEIKVTSEAQKLPVGSNVDVGYRNSQVDPIVNFDKHNSQVNRVMDFENHSLQVDPAVNFDKQNSQGDPVVDFDQHALQTRPAIDFENHSIPYGMVSNPKTGPSNVKKDPSYGISIQSDSKPRKFYQSSQISSSTRSYLRDPSLSSQKPRF